MADYKTLHGSHIEVVASDPSNPVAGQVWYNTSSNVMKGFTSNPAGSWASGGDLNTARSDLGGAGATKDAALGFGGSPPPAPTAKAITESYNGSTWTEVADFNTARAYCAGAGTYTSAIASGGDQLSGTSESWNGTSWTEVGDVNTARGYVSGDGTSTSGLIYAGVSATPARVANAESWNGTAWTEVGDLSTARNGGPLGGAGSGNTNALMFGGTTGSVSVATEEFTSPTETTVTFNATDV